MRWISHELDRIIAFFRDNTTHEKGVGYVCKYAVFDDINIGKSIYNIEGSDGKSDRLHQGKVEKSMLNFKVCEHFVP